MGWSDGSGRHNYFSLIFYPDFIEESGATRPRKTCQVRVPLVSGYVFTRCLGGGSWGSEGKANKQVAEGGRGETLIPCCARPLLQ